MMKRKVPVDRAIDTLRGYCSKVPTCGKCRFSTDGQCPFMQETPPCDWEMDKRRQEKEAGA